VDKLHYGIFTSLRIIPLRGAETFEICDAPFATVSGWQKVELVHPGRARATPAQLTRFPELGRFAMAT
jgi:hypothetical protein